MTDTRALALTVRALLPELKADLARLVAIPSVSAPGFPEETHGPLLEMHEAVVGLFRDVGVETGTLELPGTAPIVTGEIPGPEGAATALLYSQADSSPPGTSRLGRRLPSRRRRGTGRFSAAAAPTRSRTSSSTSGRSAPGEDGRRSGSSS